MASDPRDPMASTDTDASTPSAWDRRRRDAPPQGWVSTRELPKDLGVWVLKNSERLGIHWDSLPHMPFFAAPLYSHEWYRKEVSGRVIAASVIVGRQLSPPEVDAVAQAGAKYCVYRSWELPFFLGLTYFLESRGRAALRFPFWTPKPTTINPYAFPGGRAGALLRGVPAVRAWHVLRVAAYASLTRLGTTVFFHSFAQSTFLAAIFRDPRLRDLREAARRIDPRQPPKRDPAVLFGDRAEQLSGDEDPSMSEAYSPFANAPEDDVPAVETADQQSQQFRYRASGTVPQGGSTARQPSQRGGPAQPQPSWQAQPAPPSPPPAPSSTSDSDAYLFDDASPVAPSTRRASAMSGDDATSWESLRLQAARGQNGGSGVSSSSNSINTQERQERQVGSWAQRRRGAATEGQDQGRGRGQDQEPALVADGMAGTSRKDEQQAFDEMLERERRRDTSDVGRRW